jgi:hypothetical protein
MYKYKYKKIKLPNGKTIDEHRLVMERHVGRKLSFNEVVHHKDGNGRNNKIENLEIRSRSNHTKMHIKKGDIILKHIPTKEERKELTIKNSKLTIDQAKFVKYSEERSCCLAKFLNVSKFIICRVRTGVTWQWI